MQEDNYRSLNVETGLLEDIEDVRKVVLRLARELEAVLRNPLVLMLIPTGVLVDEASLVVSARSLVQPMSQAAFLRQLGSLMGGSQVEIEQYIREGKVSEVYPMTHPNATPPPDKLKPLDPNDPLVKSSVVLSEVAKLENERLAVQQERVDLPPTIDEFLKGLINKSEADERHPSEAEDSTQERGE